VTSLTRPVAPPEIPTVAESGLPGYEATAWQGVLAPAATPRDIIVRMNTEIVRVINQPQVRRQLADQGYEPVGSSPEQFAAYIKSEILKWTRVIKAAGLKAE
jgi:tripartite-type tricarboxylate transporter receptor subunit TctC